MLQKWEQAPKCGSNEEEKKATLKNCTEERENFVYHEQAVIKLWN
jgi:hypothetical protein